jgi:sulfate transport system substrate-binding protein
MEKAIEMKCLKFFILLLLVVSGFTNVGAADNGISLLNVSYDPTRELFKEFNQAFAGHWKEETGQDVTVNVSNGGSGKQARAVIDGLESDVVTLALSNDIDAISSKSGLLPKDWQTRLPYNSSPYTSTIVFVVRKGNPKNITDWDDLVKPGVSLVTPNPKTGGASRWAFLAAWGYALDKYGLEDKAREFVTKFYKNVAVLDSGSRGSTTTFAQRGIGDVLVTWENEAHLTLKEFGEDNYQIVIPSISILAEPSVAWVDANNKKHGTEKISQDYLKWLYSKEGQEIIARNFYRPRDKKLLAEYKDQFPKIKLFTINQVFGGWRKAQAAYFDDGGVFDQIYQTK